MQKEIGYCLIKGSIVKNYTVLFTIKKGNNAETYRVKGNEGKLYFLKLFNYAKLHRSAFDSENNLLEIEFLKTAVIHGLLINDLHHDTLIYASKTKLNYIGFFKNENKILCYSGF